MDRNNHPLQSTGDGPGLSRLVCAGSLASVVLLTLGVPEEEVIEQYLLSNRAAEQIIEQASEREGGYIHDAVRPLIGVHETYIEASFTAVHEEWGDFDGYLHEGLGITDAEREAIRKNLLE